MAVAASQLTGRYGLGAAVTVAPLPRAESLLVGGSNCSDFMDGAAIGLGIGVLFGCVWCGAGAIIAKGVALFC